METTSIVPKLGEIFIPFPTFWALPPTFTLFGDEVTLKESALISIGLTIFLLFDSFKFCYAWLDSLIAILMFSLSEISIFFKEVNLF